MAIGVVKSLKMVNIKHNYAKVGIKLRVILTDIKEVDVEVDKTKVKMSQGKADFIFDGYLETDYEHRRDTKPLFYFLRALFNKYVFKPYTSGYQSYIMGDVNDLHARI